MIAIFLSSFFLIGCAQYPKVTINRLDTKNQIVYPYKVNKYNDNTCELELVDEPIKSLWDPSMHGSICVSIDDYKKLQSKAKADCLNQRN